MTQFELPKIYARRGPGSSGQRDLQPDRRAAAGRGAEQDDPDCIFPSSLDGPQRPWNPEGSAVPGLEGLFGMTVLKPDFDRESLLCIAPPPVPAETRAGLTFSPSFRIGLDPVRVAFRRMRGQIPVWRFRN